MSTTPLVMNCTLELGVGSDGRIGLGAVGGGQCHRLTFQVLPSMTRSEVEEIQTTTWPSQLL